MKIFVTGASGFIGSEVTKDLIAHGYEVLGLARSDASAQKLTELGASVLRGELTDSDVLKEGAASCDGVMHLGFVHNFNEFGKSLDIDRQATEAMASVMEGTNKPFVYTNGLLILTVPIGAPALDETFRENRLGSIASKRAETELFVLGLKEKAIKGMSIRLSPTVHGAGDHGFVPWIKQCCEKNGYAAYVGEGENIWPAVHRLDAAKLYRLAIEKGDAGEAYHAAAELVKFKEIASALAKKYNWEIKSIPEESSADFFQFLGRFATLNAPAKTEYTRKKLDWTPSGLTLAEDIAQNY